MNYNQLLDTWLGSRLFSYGIPLFLILAGFIVMKIRSSKKNTKRKLVVLLFGVPAVLSACLFLANHMFLGYGPPKVITHIYWQQGKLIVLDYIEPDMIFSSQGDDRCYRAHVIDPVNGKKLRRFMLGYADEPRVIGMNGNNLMVDYTQRIEGYSILNGKRNIKYSEKTLPGLFPELALGIKSIHWNYSPTTLKIEAMNGDKWYLNLLTSNLTKEPILDSIIEQTESKPLCMLVSKEDEGNDAKRYVTDQHGAYLLNDQPFLDGDWIAISEKDSFRIILHYETLAQTKFFLTGISLDGKNKLWELSFEQNHSKKNPDSGLHIEFVEETNQLFFNVNQEIFSVDCIKGSILWKQQL